MAVKSRRKAREVALRALYELELGHMPFDTVLAESMAQADLSDDLKEFATFLISGAYKHRV